VIGLVDVYRDGGEESVVSTSSSVTPKSRVNMRESFGVILKGDKEKNKTIIFVTFLFRSSFALCSCCFLVCLFLQNQEKK
jgi:hypothetical protein